MGHKFSLVLSREITGEESEILREAGCACAVFATDTLPTNAEVTVAKMDFDDTESPSLAEAIEAALEAVKNVPDLTVPGLTVPAVPKAPADVIEGTVVDGTVVEGTVVDGTVVEEKPAAKKLAAKKPAARKAGTRKTSVKAVSVSD